MTRPTHDQALARLRAQLRARVLEQVPGRVPGRLRAQVWDQVWDQLRARVVDQARAQANQHGGLRTLENTP